MAMAIMMPLSTCPRKAIKTAKIFDPRFVGRISPYPTVVAVMNDQ
jgi:hypothetical protein